MIHTSFKVFVLNMAAAQSAQTGLNLHTDRQTGHHWTIKCTTFLCEWQTRPDHCPVVCISIEQYFSHSRKLEIKRLNAKRLVKHCQQIDKEEANQDSQYMQHLSSRLQHQSVQRQCMNREIGLFTLLH